MQPLLLTLDEGYLLTAALPDRQRGIAPLGPPEPAQPWLLGRGVGMSLSYDKDNNKSIRDWKHGKQWNKN